MDRGRRQPFVEPLAVRRIEGVGAQFAEPDTAELRTDPGLDLALVLVDRPGRWCGSVASSHLSSS